ncbi:MAG TPA: holo-[acyl-carrier-protein] synthase [Candidatus Acetothermia bacterium]|nr:holo-ACP synthase [Candidatus Bipolaricaulota bacterium]HDI11453.1 holo-[acyl-carrier-protein] synthase [Candidatus Acetothermia bacterium]
MGHYKGGKAADCPLSRIGVDLVEVKRIHELLERYGDRFLQRFFSPAEVSYALAVPSPLREERLAARFAAKEAFIKALGKTVPLREVQVLKGERGAPSLEFRGKRYPVSLSHTRDLAVAVVLIPPGRSA